MESNLSQRLGRALVLLTLMAFSSVLATFLRPERAHGTPTDAIDYRTIIPRAFHGWAEVATDQVGIVNPQEQQLIDAIYRQVVTRAYRHAETGELVMLSIAHGEAQTKQAQVHLPERCYPAQGLSIDSVAEHEMNISGRTIPAVRMIAIQGARQESVTYWIRLGRRIVRGAFEQKVATIREGLAGIIVDGLIFRVSTIGPDPQRGFDTQDRFLRELLEGVAPEFRSFLVGSEEQS